MAVKVAYWTGSYYYYPDISNSVLGWDALAQKFTIEDDYDIEYVKVSMAKHNGSTVTIAIYDRDNGNPSSSLGSKVVDASGWSTSCALRTITFDSPISLSAGNYAIVATEDTNMGTQWCCSTAGGGTGGALKRVDGSWYAVGTPDRTFGFEVWATENPPEKPINPTPTDAADDVTLDHQTITWEDGGDATSYDVYYGDTSGDLTLVSEGQVGTSFTIWNVYLGSPFDYLITRYWRIDAVNDAGTTTGDEWSFACIAFDPPLPTGVTLDAEGNPTGTPTGENNMVTLRKLVAAARNKIFYENI